MDFPIKYLFRPNDEILRLAVCSGAKLAAEEAAKKLPEMMMAAATRLGKFMWRSGYEPGKNLSFDTEVRNYGFEFGVCALMEGKKHDDARALIFGVLKESSELRESLQAFKNEVQHLKSMLSREQLIAAGYCVDEDEGNMEGSRDVK